MEYTTPFLGVQLFCMKCRLGCSKHVARTQTKKKEGFLYSLVYKNHISIALFEWENLTGMEKVDWLEKQWEILLKSIKDKIVGCLMCQRPQATENKQSNEWSKENQLIQ